MSADDARLSAPSAARNRGPILDAIAPHLPPSGLVLEIASGTGEHVAYFAAARPELTWQPTDPEPDRRASIDAWTAGLPNVRPARPLDAAAAAWPVRQARCVLCINMIHISPWSAAEGLLAGASRVLPAGGLLVLYGPYRWRDQPMAAGNAAFDADLRRRNPEWGLRTVEAVSDLARCRGFGPPDLVAMPSDNLTLLFRRL